MKRNVFFTIVAIFAIQLGYTQVPVLVDFNSTGSGRSINMLASKQFHNRHELGGGICININKQTLNDDQFCVFRKRMYSIQPIEFFGVEGFYQIHFLKNLEHIDLFAFYDIQYRFSHCRSWFGDYTEEGKRIYILYGPFHWIEQNIGIGFSVDIWKNLFLIQRIGGGINLIVGYGKPEYNAMIAKPMTEWEFGYLLSSGIGYRF